MKKIILTCTMLISLFIGLCFGLKGNAAVVEPTNDTSNLMKSYDVNILGGSVDFHLYKELEFSNNSSCRITFFDLDIVDNVYLYFFVSSIQGGTSSNFTIVSDNGTFKFMNYGDFGSPIFGNPISSFVSAYKMYQLQLNTTSFTISFTTACHISLLKISEIINDDTLSVDSYVYDYAYDKGHTAGEQSGYDKGHTAGYNEGYTAGETAGEQSGYDKGHTAGYDEGYTAGETAGEQSGYDKGHTAGYNEGYTAGEQSGYDKGHTAGYNEGYAEGKAYYSSPQYIYGNLYNVSWSMSYLIDNTNMSMVYDMGIVPANAYVEQGIDLTVLFSLANEKMKTITGIDGGYFDIYFNVNDISLSSNYLYTISSYKLYDHWQTYTFSALSGGAVVFYKNVVSSLPSVLPVEGSQSFSFSKNYNQICLSGFYSKDNSNYGYLSNLSGIESATLESVRQQGKNEGYIDGYSVGYDEGKIAGIQQGYNAGYTEGSGSDNTLVGMIYAIVDAPFQILKDSMNFNFLGVNIAEFIFSLITLIIVIKIFKMFL